MAVSDQPYIYEVKRRSNERHPLFYFMSFAKPCSPLTAIVIVQIFYINETTSPPIHDCDAVGVAITSGAKAY
jgi:hypothetical protein